MGSSVLIQTPMLSPFVFLSLRIVVYPGMYTSESAMDWLHLVSVTIAMSALCDITLCQNSPNLLCRPNAFYKSSRRSGLSTGIGWRKAIISVHVSPLGLSEV